MEVSRGKQISVSIGAFLLMFATAIVSNSTGYFINAVTDAIQISHAQFSVYYSIVQLTTACVSLAIGFFYSRFSLRQLFVAGSLGTCVGFLIMSRLTSLWMVYLGALFIGFFQAMIIVPIVKVVNSWIPGKNNGLVLGLVMSATGFGGVMMGQLMPRIVAYISWRTGYIVCAAMFLVITIVGNILAGGKSPYEVQNENAGEDTKARDAAYVSKALRMPTFYLIFFCCLLGCGSNVIFQHMSAHLQNQGMDVAVLAAIMSVWALALAFAKIAEGWLYSHMPQKLFIILFAVISTIAYIPMLSKSTGILTLGVILMGISGAAITVIYPSIINGIFGKEMTSAIWGFCWGAFQFGSASFVILYGAMFDKFGSYNTGFVVGGIGTAVVWIIFIIMFVVAGRKKE